MSTAIEDDGSGLSVGLLTYEQMLIYWIGVAITPNPATIEPDTAGCGAEHDHDAATLDRLRAAMLGPGTVEAVADLFKLLADPTRVRIVDVLSRGERCVCDIATLVGLSESAVSHQLRLLRGARLVRVRRSGRHAYYSLDDHHVVGLIHDGRRHVEEVR